MHIDLLFYGLFLGNPQIFLHPINLAYQSNGTKAWLNFIQNDTVILRITLAMCIAKVLISVIIIRIALTAHKIIGSVQPTVSYKNVVCFRILDKYRL